jgi:hypothetical protein
MSQLTPFARRELFLYCSVVGGDELQIMQFEISLADFFCYVGKNLKVAGGEKKSN